LASEQANPEENNAPPRIMGKCNTERRGVVNSRPLPVARKPYIAAGKRGEKSANVCPCSKEGVMPCASL